MNSPSLEDTEMDNCFLESVSFHAVYVMGSYQLAHWFACFAHGGRSRREHGDAARLDSSRLTEVLDAPTVNHDQPIVTVMDHRRIEVVLPRPPHYPGLASPPFGDVGGLLTLGSETAVTSGLCGQNPSGFQSSSDQLDQSHPSPPWLFDKQHR